MAARAGRAQRPVGVGKTATPTTVRLTRIDVAERAAAALGTSRDAYLDALLAHEAMTARPDGTPRWWPQDPSEQQELPLKSA